ncbi:ABC transporter permease [Antarcticirhabdus aurantiaca]|uniref:ABC transporter permease n=1 Tax=Antarcticirhabdus aurantiaca TaxID=2606717 RepID=UPI0018EF1AEC|nr:ABC transporter permease subunit [Antarcticirhabdus aurantiaca]
MSTASIPLTKSAPLSFETRVRSLKLAIVASLLLIWEAMARSGLLFEDVVPSIVVVVAALGGVLVDPVFYSNLAITAWEVGTAILVGGVTGLAVGFVLGNSRFLSRAYEPFLYYLGPTPKIIFFPLLIMWFGIGPGSKAALGALSSFFPIAIATAAAIRSVDPILLRVGASFRLSRWQTFYKIFLPAIRGPLTNGFRLGLGIAIIGTVLAETKLSNQGIGYLIIQTYTTFNMARMYALLLLLFAIAILLNAALSRLARRFGA